MQVDNTLRKLIRYIHTTIIFTNHLLFPQLRFNTTIWKEKTKMKKRALVIIAVAVTLLVSLVAVPLTASAEGPVPHVAIPQHPYMAPNGMSNMHNDGYMTDTYEITGPNGTNPRVDNTGTAPRLAVTITFDQFGRLVAVLGGADGNPVLRLYDPDTLAMLKGYALPVRPYPIEEDELPITEDPSGGACLEFGTYCRPWKTITFYLMPTV